MDQFIINFIAAAIREQLLDPIDRIYTRNRLLALLDQPEIKLTAPTIDEETELLDLLAALVESAVKQELIPDQLYARQILEAQIMDLLTPLPSVVNANFWKAYEKSPEAATDYFYQLSKQTNYIKTRDIAKNISFEVDSEFGPLELTINLSKPEKDPHEIRLAAQTESASYPSSALSADNEGFAGSLTQAARSNHRIVRFTLNDEAWGMQYSPYMYYDEHCIFLSIEDRLMKVNAQTVANLLTIVEELPHYFVGSNAGLPIVGGSILSHDHYQGGRHTFPIEAAATSYTFSFEKYPNVQGSILHWPMSVLRFEAADPKDLIAVAEAVFKLWENYSDEAVDIYARSGQTPHNAITPLARKVQERYQIDLVLRNNHTTADYPDGVFHSHPAVQHIKKENIGLIEVMGRAILPPRLATELQQVRKYLLKESQELPTVHRTWAQNIVKDHPNITHHNVDDILRQATGEVFVEMLENAGVFKLDKKGQQAFLKFVEELQTAIDRKGE